MSTPKTNPFCETANGHFSQLCEDFFSLLKEGEDATCNLQSEQQDYLRFNGSKVRQSTFVQQHDLQIQFQSRNRRLDVNAQLSGHRDEDLLLLKQLLARAREEVQVLPEDPYLVPMSNSGESHRDHVGRPPEARELVDYLAECTRDTEFTGLYATGPMVRGNRNSRGQKHWFSSDSFFLDYSLYTLNSERENKAVKACYSSNQWQQSEFLQDLNEAKLQLKMLQKKSKVLAPGIYRAFLTPSALDELVQMLSWGALSLGSYKRGQCALAKLYEGKEQLSSKVHLSENFDLGMGPQFTPLGELTPMQLPLIQGGKLTTLLSNLRSAKEYGTESNGADLGENPRSLELKPGTLTRAETLKKLETGVYLSNLHYANWSDLQNARITGMTRYACFWVDKGEIVAPIKDMRFDESLFRLLGAHLEELTAESRIIPSTGTYQIRQLGGKKLPGLLASEFRFTL